MESYEASRRGKYKIHGNLGNLNVLANARADFTNVYSRFVCHITLLAVFKYFPRKFIQGNVTRG